VTPPSHAKQARFARLLARLILWAEEQGYEVTLGEVWRPRWVAEVYFNQGKGSMESLHTCRLAADLNLFVDGRYQTASEAHAPLGAHWKGLDPEARWGGDFTRWDKELRKQVPAPDGNHYSLEHEGHR